jgi:hypothetical protein
MTKETCKACNAIAKAGTNYSANIYYGKHTCGKETSEVPSWSEEIFNISSHYLDDKDNVRLDVDQKYLEETIRQTIKTEREQAVKEERERIIKALPKEKEEIKPTEYRYICYGGSVCTRIDDWGDKKIKECPYKGDINWAVPACEKCDGKINGDLINTEYEEYKNREIKQYNLALEEVKKIIN